MSRDLAKNHQIHGHWFESLDKRSSKVLVLFPSCIPGNYKPAHKHLFPYKPHLLLTHRISSSPSIMLRNIIIAISRTTILIATLLKGRWYWRGHPILDNHWIGSKFPRPQAWLSCLSVCPWWRMITWRLHPIHCTFDQNWILKTFSLTLPRCTVWSWPSGFFARRDETKSWRRRWTPKVRKGIPGWGPGIWLTDWVVLANPSWVVRIKNSAISPFCLVCSAAGRPYNG